ncbi:uncharacterized protein UTRI_05874_B [Ustilago trichophora]|uniref:Uncharacterized protein n=1 Tax=Ustilago trichophora TaxID=86804 RepID=A0A5C3EPB2_9BASI|nr:uncharacterized protein UTRI_05874_B [Ustilago trichophora]
MVHPLVITAAATAGIGAAVAFEVTIFRPWRDENWPHGFGQGVRSEFLKLRREVEQAVNEIQDDFRTLRDGRRRSRTGHRRLSDDELDDFRRGVGEEASRESAQHEFEMHERQASAYRDRLRASMSESMASGSDAQDHGRGLRRRRPTGPSNDADGQQREANSFSVPVIDLRRPTSPELPHHALGDASPSVVDAASLPPDSRFNSVRSVGKPQPLESSRNATSKGDSETDAAKNILIGLEFGQQEEAPASVSASSAQQVDTANVNDPFATIVDDTASSWHAVFSDRATENANNIEVADSLHLSSSSPGELTDEGHVVLDTAGLSQTLSDQQHSFHDLEIDAHDNAASNAPDSPYRSNRALHPPSQTAPSTGSRSGRSEPDFEVLSDTADSESRWSHLHAPPSPTISSGSEPVDVGEARGIDVFSVTSDGEDSWAEVSEASSEGEGRVSSVRV